LTLAYASLNPPRLPRRVERERCESTTNDAAAVASFVTWRVLAVVPVLLAVATILFLLIHFAPGDPAAIMMGGLGQQSDIDRVRRELGLDRPLHIQYLRFLDGVAHGDLGRSFRGNDHVAQAIAYRYPATVELAVAGMLLALTIGIPVGILSATRQYSLFDHLSMLVSLTGISMPSFWLGLQLIVLLSVDVKWLPVSGRISVDTQVQPITNLLVLDSALVGNWSALADVLKHLLMPATVLGVVLSANIARLTRASMLDILHQDYVRTARAKGLGERRVVIGHAFRNALIPTLTIVGIQLGHLLGGAVIIETVFAWPGIGKLLVGAIGARDHPMVLGVGLVMAATFVLLNLVVDVLQGWVDPRVRYA
jgi:peptide/nickel transport system permease protein